MQLAGDLLGFDSDGKFTGYEDLLSFVPIYRAKVDVKPEDSRQGGLMAITFSTVPWTEGIAAAVEKKFVSVAADQIAVYEIYAGTGDKNNILYIRFKRGNMPNELWAGKSLTDRPRITNRTYK